MLILILPQTDALYSFRQTNELKYGREWKGGLRFEVAGLAGPKTFRNLH